MLNVVDEQTTETDQVELTVSDEEEEEDADTGCEVIDEEDEQSSSFMMTNSDKVIATAGQVQSDNNGPHPKHQVKSVEDYKKDNLA